MVNKYKRIANLVKIFLLLMINDSRKFNDLLIFDRFRNSKNKTKGNEQFFISIFSTGIKESLRISIF